MLFELVCKLLYFQSSGIVPQARFTEKYSFRRVDEYKVGEEVPVKGSFEYARPADHFLVPIQYDIYIFRLLQNEDLLIIPQIGCYKFTSVVQIWTLSGALCLALLQATEGISKMLLKVLSGLVYWNLFMTLVLHQLMIYLVTK